jgi:hypothetical protein
MDRIKQQIQQRLIASIIIDKCSQSDYLIFRDAWCTQDRVIRFTTPFFRKLFSCDDNGTGKWKTGDCVMYEANNGADSFLVNCVLSLDSIPYAAIGHRDALLKALGIKTAKASNNIILKSWDLTRGDGDANKLFEDFDHLIEKEIPYFEKELQEKLEADKPEPVEFHEGTAEYVTLNKYERNQKAREACIAAHGTACAVCGIDFGKAYGPEFAGKIEVHHIVPISEIGEDYVVDPVKDLVPVCPNCHTALHSKKDGVYTVEELKRLRSNNYRE